MSRCARIRPAVFFAIIAALMLLTPGTPVLAGNPIDEALETCRQTAMDTVSIGQCTTTARQQWDKELNAAYAALMQTLEPGAREALKASERAWIGLAMNGPRPWPSSITLARLRASPSATPFSPAKKAMASMGVMRL